MSFDKIRTIKVSERVFDYVCSELDLAHDDYGFKIDGWLETFNNCREQGYMLTITSDTWKDDRTEDDLHVWAFESRNSDDIVVIWSSTYPQNAMFSEQDWTERNKHFKYNETYQAAEFIIDLVKKHFKYEFEQANY